MEQILDKLITVICAIIVAAGGFVIAWLESRKRKLEEKKHAQTRKELTHAYNGFREHVYTKLTVIENKQKALEAKVEKLIKEKQ